MYYCCLSLESACCDNALYPATVVNMPKTSSQGSVCMRFSFIQKRVYRPRMLAMPPWKAIAATHPAPSFGKPCKRTPMLLRSPFSQSQLAPGAALKCTNVLTGFTKQTHVGCSKADTSQIRAEHSQQVTWTATACHAMLLTLRLAPTDDNIM